MVLRLEFVPLRREFWLGEESGVTRPEEERNEGRRGAPGAPGSGGQVRQVALGDPEGGQAHQGAHQEADGAHVAVPLALHVHKAPRQRQEGEEAAPRGQVHRHQVHGADQTFAQQEAAAPRSTPAAT